MACCVNITRHPFSGAGSSPRDMSEELGKEGGVVTWADSLEAAGHAAPFTALSSSGERAGLQLDFGVEQCWQPVDAHRATLWCGRQGKQEEFAHALGVRHFTKCESSCRHETLLDAVEDVGLPRTNAAAFLTSRELVQDVWDAFAETHALGASRVPMFVFNGPMSNGGPFRSGGGRPYIVSGPADTDTFLAVLRSILGDAQALEQRNTPSPAAAQQQQQQRQASEAHAATKPGGSRAATATPPRPQRRRSASKRHGEPQSALAGVRKPATPHRQEEV